MIEHSHGRRRFLSLAARATAATPLAALLPRSVLAAAAAIPRGIIVRNDWPEHWESAPAALDAGYLTNAEAFFVRSHLGVPEPDASAWRLAVTGLVEQPLDLSLAELHAFPVHERDVTLECAGNGRARYALASSSGTQWELGAVGNARWRGVKMSEVLARAGAKPEARHVWLECADQAPVPGVPAFVRSIPLALANSDAMLAWDMNGRALPKLHGAPLRAIVPGWFAMASAKWVTGLRVDAAPSDNHFMVRGYRYVYPGADPAAAPPVETMRVKSLITWPRAGDRVRAGALDVRGVAWTGDGVVERVELSPDDGGGWSAGTLLDDAKPGAWRRWTARVTLPAGRRSLQARATDSFGETQPAQARANAAGYANNSIHGIHVDAH